MNITTISYHDLMSTDASIIQHALFNDGIIGIKDVPDFLHKSQQFIQTARKFAALDSKIKEQYAPKRDDGDTEGYELGAEWFQDAKGNWHVDDKKASYYAFVPDRAQNKWPREIDLKTAYLELGHLIFNTGKLILDKIGLNHHAGVDHDKLIGYGRLLHYQKENDATNENAHWCGAHFDHGIFTGLMPAYYFENGNEVAEPSEAGLFIKPTNGKDFVKINSTDKSTLLFQVGEFAQLVTHDRICATEHLVRKAKSNIERFTFALFYSPDAATTIQSKSTLAKDSRYIENMSADKRINFEKWNAASFAKYRAK